MLCKRLRQNIKELVYHQIGVGGELLSNQGSVSSHIQLEDGKTLLVSLLEESIYKKTHKKTIKKQLSEE